MFPQKPPHDRFFVDYQGFFANVPCEVRASSDDQVFSVLTELKGDQYDSFRIPFGTVQQISFTRSASLEHTIQVTIYTVSPPEFGSSPGWPYVETFSTTVLNLAMKDLERFKEALSARGVVSSIPINIECFY